MPKEREIDTTFKLDKVSLIIIIVSICIVIFSFIAPTLFVKNSFLNIDFTNKGEIGDTIGGIMNPFIAIAGVLITFLAFYIQFKANQLQRQLFRIELKSQNEQFEKNQFENQFYEMISLHKNNVDEVQLVLRDFFNKNQINHTINGRKVFKYLIKEFELIYILAKQNFPDEKPKTWVNEAYGVFFHGLTDNIEKYHPFFEQLKKIEIEHSKFHYQHLTRIINEHFKFNWNFNLNFPVFEGYSSQIAHYYRHLFHIVKFVAHQDEDFLNYSEKRKYLRILRAQLSNEEQALLFYNWFSGFGNDWESKENKFFTDFRMIHNIYPAILMPEIDINKLFSQRKGHIRTDSTRKKDSLFEFQDWPQQKV